MAGQDVLREFLVAIGWKNDDVGMRKAFDAISKAEKSLVALAAAAEVASLAVVAALGKMAESFEKAYYASSRTGVAVRELNAFKYAASQTGSSAEEAAAAVEGLAEKIKGNRGFRTLVQGITGDKTGDYAKQIVELGQAFKGMTSERAVATANMLGLSSTLRQSLMNPEFLQFEKEYEDKASAMGVDLEKAAADGKSLTQAFRGVRTTLDLIIDAAATPLFQKLDGPIRALNDFLTLHGKEIASIIGDIASALLRITTIVLENLPNIDKFAKSLGGWETVFAGLAAVISVAFLARMAGLLTAMRGLSLLSIPPGVLAILGVGAAGVAALRNMPEDRKDQVIDGTDGLRELHQHHVGGAWNAVKGAFGFGPNGNDALWLRSRRGKNARDSVRSMRSGATYRDTTNYTGNNANVVRQAAKELGTSPEDLATVIAYETGGRFSPSIHGGKGGNYQGLIQFGPAERAQFGANDKQSFAQQMPAVVSYLKTRGFKPGMGLLDLYSTINAGSPGHYNASDGNGTVTSHVERMQREQAANVRRFLASTSAGTRALPGRDANGMPIPGVDATGKPVTPFGAFNPNALRSQFNAQPLGTSGAANNNGKSIIINDNSKTEVHGVNDPTKAADHVGSADDRRQSILLRNLQSAVG